MLNFKGRYFPKDMILMSIRWYLAYSLSYRDVEELMLEGSVANKLRTISRETTPYLI